MTYQEFTTKTGLTPTAEEYHLIEAMYMATGNMHKDEFCKEYKKIGCSHLVIELFHSILVLQNQNEIANNNIEHCLDEKNQMVDFLIDLSEKISNKDLLNKAVEIVGQREVIRRKLEKDYNILTCEKAWLLNNLL